MHYSVKAVARATGVSESRLRTWERRYGTPNPARSASGRREYDDEDLEVVRHMAALVNLGVSAVYAAAAAREGWPAAEAPEETQPEHRLVSFLVAAAEAYNERRFLAAMATARDELGLAGALDGVVFPALQRLGTAWETAGLAPVKEHFASELVRRVLMEAQAGLSPSGLEAPILVMACPEGERHDLGLLALSVLVREAGINLIYLGADVPAVDLLSLADEVNPAAVCLSAVSSAGLAALVRTSRLLVTRRSLRIFVGGPGLETLVAPAAGQRLPEALAEATSVIVAALSPGPRPQEGVWAG